MRPDLLTFTRELLINPAAAEDVARAARTRWTQGELELRLTYRFEPGTAHDGVTVHVPLKTLPQLRSEGFEWLVPGAARRARHRADPLAAEGAAQAARARSRTSRRRCSSDLEPRQRPLLDALAAEIEAQRGVRIAARPTGTSRRLPAYLKMTFSVEDEQGKVIAAGQDLSALREQVRPKLRAALAAGHAQARAHRARRRWTFGKIPKVVALPGTGQTIRAYPSLVDEGDDGRPARARERRGAAAEHARGHAPAAGADDPLPAARLPGQARQRRPRSR